MKDFEDEISNICLEKYESLKKNGKPTDDEWTILSGILCKDMNGALSLLSLATGTKCLGRNELLNTLPNERGCRLSDSHAEVLARRAFLRFLYNEIDGVLDGTNSDILFANDDGKLELHKGVSFHFYSTQTPCGDCSIFPKNKDNDQVSPSKMRKIIHNDQDYPVLELNEIDDTFRTGAKCVETADEQDPKLPGINYHVIGALRTKPGRGDPTTSLSCSDKIAKWNVLGLQGSFLSTLIPKIKLETITIGGNSPFSLDAMERGLYKRFDIINGPTILRSKRHFAHGKTCKRIRPCPSSIIWCNVLERNLEIAVEGRKQGMTKKKKANSLLVSRKMLFKTFLNVCDKYYQTETKIITHPKKITYYQIKHWSTGYQKTWMELKSKAFRSWPEKPCYLQDFVL